jgi:hypothetical protein
MESRMRLRHLFMAPVVLALLAAGIACSGGDEAPQAATGPATQSTTTPTLSPTTTPTATATATPTPEPTPEPYNGAVKRLKLPRFGVDAPIEELAINARGELDTPRDENRAVAWYFIYDKPGRPNPENVGWYTYGGRTAEMPAGNSVFSAHVYYNNVPAPFQNLARSQKGDRIIVEMEDGREYVYEVISYNRYPADAFPMAQVLWPPEKPADEEWITLITCGGRRAGDDYLDREVVVAKRVPDSTVARVR